MELSAERVHRANGTYYRRTGLEGRHRDARHRRRRDLARGRAPHPRRARRGARGGGRAEGRARLHLRHDARRARAHRHQRRERREAAHLRRLRRTRAAVAAEAARGGARRARRPVHRVARTGHRARLRGVVGVHARRHAAAFADAADPAGRAAGASRRSTSTARRTCSTRHPSTTSRAGRMPRGHDVVDLLQAYDEYIMGYAPPRAYLQPPDARIPCARVPPARHRDRRGDGRSVGAGRRGEARAGADRAVARVHGRPRSARSRHPSPRWSGSSACRSTVEVEPIAAP